MTVVMEGDRRGEGMESILLYSRTGIHPKHQESLFSLTQHNCQRGLLKKNVIILDMCSQRSSVVALLEILERNPEIK